MQKKIITNRAHVSLSSFPEIIEGVKRASPGPAVLGAAAAASSSVVGGGVGVSSPPPPPPVSSSSSSGLPLRPTVDEDAADEEIIRMMTRCWSEDPLDRPDFQALKVAIRKLNK